MQRPQIIGLIIIALGIGMLVIGAGMFTYNGGHVSRFVASAGEFAFSACIPLLVLGFGFLLLAKKKEKERRR